MNSTAFIIGLLSFLTLIDLFGTQALLPQLTALFDATPGAMGVAVGASTFGMAAAGLVVAMLSRRIDRKKGIVISLALLSIPTVLLGFTENLTVFTWLRVLQGAAMSTAFTLTMSYLAENCSVKEAANAMAAYITGNVLSNLLGRLMAANFNDWFGLSQSFWIFAALNLCGAVLAYMCLKNVDPLRADPNAAPMGRVMLNHIKNRRLQAGFLLGFLILFVFLSIFTYVNFVLASAPFSLSSGQLGLVYLVFIPAMFTTPLAGGMTARFGVYKSFNISMFVALVGILALLVPSLPVVLIGMAMIGVGTFCAQAAVTGFIGVSAKTERAAASGIYLGSYYLGGLMGAFVIGKVFSASGWPASIAAVVGVTLISFIIARPLRHIPDTKPA